MKVAIVTLQLHTNYGGVLQAFALQRIIENLGNEVEIIQLGEILPEPRGMNALRRILTRSFRKYVLGQRGVEIFRERRINGEFPIVGVEFVRFFREYMNIRHVSSFNEIGSDDYDAFVVGSDQVWRPEYNPNLLHSYLDFTWADAGRHDGSAPAEAADGMSGGWNVRRLAYAVSFGSDVWEYPKALTRRARRLAARFDALSFRELSGVENAGKHLGVSSETVLDPAMLFDADEYVGLIRLRKGQCRGRRKDFSPPLEILEYILDRTADTEALVTRLEGQLAMPARRFLTANPRGRGEISLRVQPSVESWISGICGASYVITDSFHACVFSILFHRPFAVVGNRGRGLSRIEWLLGQLGLESRFVGNGDSLPGQDMGWDDVDARLDRLRSESMDFLKKNLK